MLSGLKEQPYESVWARLERHEGMILGKVLDTKEHREGISGN